MFSSLKVWVIFCIQISFLKNILKSLFSGGEKGQHLHVVKNKKILPREKLKYIFDENSETLELCLLAGLGMDYGDIPGGSVVCGM